MLYTFADCIYPRYSTEQGFGFLHELSIENVDYLEWFGGVIALELKQLPQIFMFDTKPGTYQIKVHFYGASSVFAQRRRLFAVCTEKGEHNITFTTVVGDVISDFDKKRHTNNRIVIVFTGNPQILSVEIIPVSVPVIWLAGDSTVADQKCLFPYHPGLSYCGWGQMLSMFLSEKCALFNLSRSGLTTDTFREQGYHQLLTDGLKAGDYVFIQFGHNDQKELELLSDGRYLDNLIGYVKEVQEKKAIPILVTPLARNTWSGGTGTYNDLLQDYTNAVIKAAQKTDCLLLDLHRVSVDYIIQKGLEGAKAYFYPGDYTHTNDYGGYQVANMIWQKVNNHTDFLELRKLFRKPDGELLIDENHTEGWLHLPEPSSPDCEHRGNITALEALQYVQKAYKYFAMNPFSDEPEAVTAARQNGYMVESLIVPDKMVTWQEWCELLTVACRGRNYDSLIPEYDASPENWVDWSEGVEYAKQLEQQAVGELQEDWTGFHIVVEGS